jgi:hypothetical protein
VGQWDNCFQTKFSVAFVLIIHTTTGPDPSFRIRLQIQQPLWGRETEEGVPFPKLISKEKSLNFLLIFMWLANHSSTDMLRLSTSVTNHLKILQKVTVVVKFTA